MGYRPGRKLRAPQRDRVSTPVSSWLNFNPLTIPNLGGWFDSSDDSTITESSGAVSQWNDKSGNGRNVSQPTAASQPLITANTLNGKKVITFDSNDILQGAQFTQAQPITVFVLCQTNNAAAGNRQILGDNFSPTVFIDGTWRLYNNTVLDSGFSIDTNFHCITGIFNGASSTLRLDRTRAATGNPSTVGYANGRIQFSKPNNNWTGSLAEVLIYFRLLTNQEIVTVETYLSSKWGPTF